MRRCGGERRCVLISYRHIISFASLSADSLPVLQDSLVALLEIENHRLFLSDIAALVVAVISQTGSSWESLDAHLDRVPSLPRHTSTS